MQFYTACAIKGSKIQVRGYRNGIRFTENVAYKPSLFIVSDKPSTYRTLKNRKVKKMTFDSFYDCRQFLDQYRELEDCPIYGNTDFVTQYLMETYPDDIQYDLSKIKVAYLDLECETEGGFPNLDDPNERINLITIRISGKNHVISLQPVNLPDCIVYVAKDERELIGRIFSILKQEDVDILTGWNIRLFDIPYIMGRALKFFSEGEVASFMPFNTFKFRDIKIGQKNYKIYELGGYNVLDYIDLYKKFSGTNQESYALNFIAKVELNQQKLDYSEYGSIREFYTKNFQKFAEYNVLDTLLVERLDDKLKLIDLAVSIAYEAKISFDTVFFATRIWETICCDYLMKQNIIPPLKTKYSKDEQFVGAYVKECTPGLYRNVVSFDATSLYPSIIMQFNISPETCIKMDASLNADDFLRSKRFEVPKAIADAKANDACMACNGSMFTNKVKGFIPILIENTFNQRQAAKKQMIDLQKEYENTKNDLLLPRIAALKIRQSVKKILANSLYGCLGNPSFTYSSPELATAVTVTGQVIIRSAEIAMNDYFNKLLKNDTPSDYVIGVDTDSVYLNLNELIEKVFEGEKHDKATDLINTICEKNIQRHLDIVMTDFSTKQNCLENKIKFKREAIASVGLFVAKKRYALLVDDLEGVRFAEPKLKIMGMEAVKSSTPMIVRNVLKDSIEIILTKDQDALRDYINEFKDKFMRLPLEDIAFPRKVSDVTAYLGADHFPAKGSPIASKAAILHNAYLKKLKLDKELQMIRDGDKIKYVYLKVPNPYGKNGRDMVMGFASTCPPQFELEKYVDRELQFEKTLLEPIQSMLNIIGWNISNQQTLESFFG